MCSSIRNSLESKIQSYSNKVELSSNIDKQLTNSNQSEQNEKNSDNKKDKLMKKDEINNIEFSFHKDKIYPNETTHNVKESQENEIIKIQDSDNILNLKRKRCVNGLNL